MHFKLLKSIPEGISGSESHFATINDVLMQVVCHDSWPTLKNLHYAILKWTLNAVPGDMFCTQTIAIVAVAANDAVGVEQKANHLLHRFIDQMALLDQRCPQVARTQATTRSIPDAIVQSLRTLADEADALLAEARKSAEDE